MLSVFKKFRSLDAAIHHTYFYAFTLMSDSEEYCLLLEDDFIVLDKIKLYVNEIKKGVQLGDVYTLGCIPFFQKHMVNI